MEPVELGRYRLLQRLGAGGMGEVFLARLDKEEGFSKRLVIKRILPELSGDARFREMFAAEARLAASLNHPNIIQVLDYGRSGDDCFLAMEYIDGLDLATLLAATQQRQARLPLGFVLGVGQACLRALGYAHRHQPPVIHGDVSPSNVLVGREGEIKLADFGLAQLAGASSRTGEIRGKLAYLAPEIAFGQAPDAQSDLFGVGAILYELLSGVPPLAPQADLNAALEQTRRCQIPSVAERVADLHPALIQIIDRALCRDRQQRFGSAEQMEEALSRIATLLAVDLSPRVVGALVSAAAPASGPSPSSEIPRTLVAAPPLAKPASGKSRSWWIGLVGAGLAGAITWLVYSGWPGSPESREVLQAADAGPEWSEGPDAGQSDLPPAPEPIPGPADAGMPPTPDAGPLAPGAAADTKRVAITRPARSEEPSSLGASADASADAGAGEGADAGAVAMAADPGPAPPPVPGFLVQVDRPARCTLDALPEGPCPLERSAPFKGSHLVKIRDPEGLSVVVRIDGLGTGGDFLLAIQSEPFALLSLDGAPRGLTPMGRIRLERGEHRVVLAAPRQRPLELRLRLP